MIVDIIMDMERVGEGRSDNCEYKCILPKGKNPWFVVLFGAREAQQVMLPKE